MDNFQLENIQQQLFFEFGFKVDLYHDETYRGIIVVKSGEPLTMFNILKAFNY